MGWRQRLLFIFQPLLILFHKPLPFPNLVHPASISAALFAPVCHLKRFIRAAFLRKSFSRILAFGMENITPESDTAPDGSDT
jgi:hypothetical protein